ncbi:transposase [Acetobacter orientalis]|uniref:transposase n=1 Tax=Acetobacter orientalis TaxID=146474 RepID=UPI0039ECFE4B
MASLLVSDDLWAVIAPLLPVIPARPKGGISCICDRAALTGILFVLVTSITWEMDGLRCWRHLLASATRLACCRRLGCLHQALLTHLHQADRIARSSVCMDSASIATQRERCDRSPPPGSR